MATRIYKTPFAATGDKEALATADQPDGKVSLQAGWTPDYELPNDNPAYRPVGRAEMNGVLNEITQALGELQQNGFAVWSELDGGWPLNAVVVHENTVYKSAAADNTATPGADSSWRALFNFPMSGVPPENWNQVALLESPEFTGTPMVPTADEGADDEQAASTAFVKTAVANIPSGSESVLGLLRVATAAEAQEFSSDTRALTPKKLADAFSGANLVIESDHSIMRFPNGVKLMSGRVAMPSGSGDVSFNLAFPEAFDSDLISVWLTPGYAPGSNAIVAVARNPTLSGMEIWADKSNSVDPATLYVYWNAMGV